MKKSSTVLVLFLCIGFLCPNTVWALAVPEPPSPIYVKDEANCLDQATIQDIVRIGSEVEEKTGAQLTVLTIPSLENEALEEYSLKVLRQWGVGKAKEDNGLLMLIVVNDRLSRIEVGYGLEGILPDGKTGRIQDEYMIPYFKDGDYAIGINEGYRALATVVADEYETTLSDAEPQSDGSFLIRIILMMILLYFLYKLFFGNRRGPRPPHSGSRRSSRSSVGPYIGFPMGGGNSGGFSGGLGGGFGGGMGGGGGSSRGW